MMPRGPCPGGSWHPFQALVSRENSRTPARSEPGLPRWAVMLERLDAAPAGPLVELGARHRRSLHQSFRAAMRSCPSASTAGTRAGGHPTRDQKHCAGETCLARRGRRDPLHRDGLPTAVALDRLRGRPRVSLAAPGATKQDAVGLARARSRPGRYRHHGLVAQPSARRSRTRTSRYSRSPVGIC